MARKIYLIKKQKSSIIRLIICLSLTLCTANVVLPQTTTLSGQFIVYDIANNNLIGKSN